MVIAIVVVAAAAALVLWPEPPIPEWRLASSPLADGGATTGISDQLTVTVDIEPISSTGPLVIAARVEVQNTSDDTYRRGRDWTPVRAWLIRSSPLVPAPSSDTAALLERVTGAPLDRIELLLLPAPPDDPVDGVVLRSTPLVDSGTTPWAPGDRWTGHLRFDESVLGGLGPGDYALVVGPGPFVDDGLRPAVERTFRVDAGASSGAFPDAAVVRLFEADESAAWREDEWGPAPDDWDLTLIGPHRTPTGLAWTLNAIRAPGDGVQLALDPTTGAVTLESA